MPLARAASAATLLVATDAMIPKPIVNTPAIQAMFGRQDHRPASLHVMIEFAGDIAQLAKLGQPFFQENDVRGVGRDRRSAA